MTLPYFTEFNNILAHFDSDRLCHFGYTQGVAKNQTIYLDKQQKIDRHIYLRISKHLLGNKLLKNTGRFIFSARGRLMDGLEFFPDLF